MAIITGQNVDPDDFIGNPAPFFSIENTVGTTHSLTTVANQKVLVIAKGYFTGSDNQQTISLQYNGVTKDSVIVRHSYTTSGYIPFCLMWVDTPGAATQNITVTTGGGSIGSVSISVLKLLVG